MTRGAAATQARPRRLVEKQLTPRMNGDRFIGPPPITRLTDVHKQGAPRPEEGAVHTAIVLGTHSISCGNDKKPWPSNFECGSLLRLRRVMYISTVNATTPYNA